MLGGLFAALRPVLAILVFGGAAAVMVAPAVDMASQRAESRAAANGAAPLRNHPDATPTPSDDPNVDPTEEPRPDFETLLRQCLERRDPDSDACAAAALESAMSYEEFRAKIVAKLEPEPTKKPETKPDPTKKPEAVVVVKKTEPVKTSTWSDFATYFEKCLGTRDINSDYCFRAEELSGLSREEFDAKFDAKLATKDSGDFWTVFDKCLDTRDVVSDICARAQGIIGFNDADFHSKFERYLAERDAQTAKKAATPKPTAKTFLTSAMFEECGNSHERGSDACIRALALSGMSTADFWAKLEAKYGAFH